jgi:hypothetical protein
MMFLPGLTGEAMMRSESDMRELVREAAEYGVEAWVALDARFGWIVRATSPFHRDPIILRTHDDLHVLVMELFELEGQVAPS